MRFVVVLDACVLYPAPLRDFLMRLATTGLFAANCHRAALRNLPKTAAEYLETLAANGLAVTADRLREYAGLL
jgi:hypothetical protein